MIYRWAIIFTCQSGMPQEEVVLYLHAHKIFQIFMRYSMIDPGIMDYFHETDTMIGRPAKIKNESFSSIKVRLI